MLSGMPKKGKWYMCMPRKVTDKPAKACITSCSYMFSSDASWKKGMLMCQDLSVCFCVCVCVLVSSCITMYVPCISACIYVCFCIFCHVCLSSCSQWSYGFYLTHNQGQTGFEFFFKTREMKKKWMEQFSMALWVLGREKSGILYFFLFSVFKINKNYTSSLRFSHN